MKCNEIIEVIRSDFGALWNCKQRGETLEIVSPFLTATGKYASVFIKEYNKEIIVSDGGWVNQGFYDLDYNIENDEFIRITEFFSLKYSIKVKKQNDTDVFYFKKTNDRNQITSIIFDMCNFISNLVSSLSTIIEDKKENEEKETFRKQANDFLHISYDNIDFNKGLDDFKMIRFSAIIKFNRSLHLINYITGSSEGYFQNSIRKAAVNLDLSQKSKYKDNIKNRISILNDTANGYKPQQLELLLEYLKVRCTHEPILWSQKEKVNELVA